MKNLSLCLLFFVGTQSIAQAINNLEALDPMAKFDAGAVGGFTQFHFKNIDDRKNLNLWNKTVDAKKPGLEIYSTKDEIENVPSTTFAIQKNSAGEVLSVRAVKNTRQQKPRISWLAQFNGNKMQSMFRCDGTNCVYADHRTCAAVDANTGLLSDTKDENFYSAIKAAWNPDSIKQQRGELGEVTKSDLVLGADGSSPSKKRQFINETRGLCSRLQFAPAKGSNTPTQISMPESVR